MHHTDIDSDIVAACVVAQQTEAPAEVSVTAQEATPEVSENNPNPLMPQSAIIADVSGLETAMIADKRPEQRPSRDRRQFKRPEAAAVVEGGNELVERREAPPREHCIHKVSLKAQKAREGLVVPLVNFVSPWFTVIQLLTVGAAHGRFWVHAVLPTDNQRQRAERFGFATSYIWSCIPTIGGLRRSEMPLVASLVLTPAGARWWGNLPDGQLAPMTFEKERVIGVSPHVLAGLKSFLPSVPELGKKWDIEFSQFRLNQKALQRNGQELRWVAEQAKRALDDRFEVVVDTALNDIQTAAGVANDGFVPEAGETIEGYDETLPEGTVPTGETPIFIRRTIEKDPVKPIDSFLAEEVRGPALRQIPSMAKAWPVMMADLRKVGDQMMK